VTLGIDGARFADALAVIATDALTGHQWPLGIWERPPSAPDDYEHPLDEVDGAVSEAFERWNVWRAYIDPQYIEGLVEKWQGRWGVKTVLEWRTNRPRQIAYAVRAYEDAMSAGDVSLADDADFLRHLKQARRQKLNVYDDQHRQLHTLNKDRPDSPRKIDAAMAAVLSWEARGDCVAAGATEPVVYRTAGF
jgi:dGTP triphosphohydrolase